MKIRTPDYYKDFKCIGGTCIDTCCAGWEVDVDKKTSAYYKSVQGEFGDRLRSMLIDCPIEDRFILQEHGRCPFLNKANLCDIFSELGEDKLCETCTNFPRHITEFGNTREIGISLSCPVAVELIMERKQPILFETVENNEKLTEYNDIDAELYFNLQNARSTLYKICQDRAIRVNERAAITLDFIRAVQKVIKNPKKIANLIDKYSDREYLNSRVSELKKYGKTLGKNIECLKNWITFFDQGLEHIKKEWHGMLEDTMDYFKIYDSNVSLTTNDELVKKKNAFLEIMAEREYECEHILVYYVYRYFLRSVFDGRAYEKIALGCTALIMYQIVGAAWFYKNQSFNFTDRITVMRIYSKETEHSEENLEKIYSKIGKIKRLRKDSEFSFKAIIGILMGDGVYR